jgi:hypothetical protein
VIHLSVMVSGAFTVKIHGPDIGVKAHHSKGNGWKVTTCFTCKGNKPPSNLFSEDENEIKPKSPCFVMWLVPLVKATIGETPAASNKCWLQFYLCTENLTPIQKP